MFHLQSGPQHEALHCHCIRNPCGARTPGDPRRSGSPENWLGRTRKCSTCMLGRNMKRCSATQYVSHAARAHQVTHGRKRSQATGNYLKQQERIPSKQLCVCIYLRVCACVCACVASGGGGAHVMRGGQKNMRGWLPPRRHHQRARGCQRPHRDIGTKERGRVLPTPRTHVAES